MSHAGMKTVFLHFSNYLPLSIILIAAAVGKPGFCGISAFLVRNYCSFGSQICLKHSTK